MQEGHKYRNQRVMAAEALVHFGPLKFLGDKKDSIQDTWNERLVLAQKSHTMYGQTHLTNFSQSFVRR
jgi:hypothetical protein